MRGAFRRLLVRLGLRKPTFTIHARVIRADGTVEDLGVISKGDVEFKPRKG